MSMDLLFSALFMILFSLGAYQDHKKREIKDELSIAIWLLCAFSGVNLQTVVVAFCLIWAISLLGEKLKAKICGWGDVLWGAPFIGVIDSVAGMRMAYVSFLICFCAAQFYLYWLYNMSKLPNEKKRGAEFVLFLASSLISTLLFCQFCL